MIKNQTKYEMADMTKSENVTIVESPPTRNCKEETSGVATQKKVRDDLKKVTILVNVLYDVIVIYGYNDKRVSKKDLLTSKKEDIIEKQKKKTIEDKLRLRNRILEFVRLSGFGSWKDFFKYKINAFFSWAMAQVVPPVPKKLEEFPDLLDPSFLFYGRAKRYLSKIKLDRVKLESFAQSIAQSKKGAPPVSPEMVSAAEMKTFVHLTTPRADQPDFILKDNIFEHPINRNTMCYQLRRTVRELFKGKFPAWEELTKPFVPSTNSQYNWSRTQQGGVGAFRKNQAISIKILEDYPDFLIKKKLGPCQLSGELSELYGSAGREDQERISNDLENVVIKESLALHYDGGKFCEFWKRDIYPTMIQEALEEEPQTMVIGLPEPLKVRCITAGPPITYAVLKPMQKWLWKTLKSQSVFQLIGTPVTQEIVTEMMGRLGLQEELVSGDYVASTDNLHSWVSECIMNALIEVWKEKEEEIKRDDKIPDEFFNYLDKISSLMFRALTGHLIMDPSFNDAYRKGDEIRDKYFKPQKEGQLMGSIISFPFLCLANAAMCRWAMEISESKNLKLTDRYQEGYERCRLLINGDDCVFPGRVELFDIWQKITAFGGLESSVGKTFRSRNFMTINSVQYKYTELLSDWDNLSGLQNDFHYQDIKYVNLGLVYGQKKDGVRGKPFYRLGAVHRDLHKTCPTELFKKASKLFLKEANKEKFRPGRKDGKDILVPDFFGCIKNAKVPYYIPEWLGGLGLVRTKQDQVNEWDLKVAAVIRANKGDLRISSLTEKSKWQFHRLVDKELEDYKFLDNQNFQFITVSDTTRDLESEYQKFYTLCVAEKLCTAADLTDIPKDEDELLRNYHFANQIIWENLRSNPGLGSLVASQQPALYEDLLREPKSFSLASFDVRE